jgi:hypothetical protein
MKEPSGSVAEYLAAIDADPQCFSAWLGLARAQNRAGQHEKAKTNCESGLLNFARSIVSEMKNDKKNPILKTSSHQKELAEANDVGEESPIKGALVLCADEENIERVAWPTGEMAAAEEQDEEHKGLYWVDSQLEGKQTRLFLPNFFNYFYNVRCGNEDYCVSRQKI